MKLASKPKLIIYTSIPFQNAQNLFSKSKTLQVMSNIRFELAKRTHFTASRSEFSEHAFLPVHPGLLLAGGVVLQQQVIIHQLLQPPLVGRAVWVVILVPALIQPCAGCLHVWCWVRYVLDHHDVPGTGDNVQDGLLPLLTKIF